MARKAGVLVGLQGMILLLFLGFNSAHGQIGKAELSGTVKDQSEAVIPGVQIRATHVATGADRETVSDARGNFVLPSLDVGEYTIVVEIPGFTTITRRGVNLLVGQRATINFVMQPASVVTQVEVTAAAPLVETTKSDVAANVDVRQMSELPLVGRDWLSMMATAPGVRSSGGIPSVGALGSRRTGVYVDGGSIKDSTGRNTTAITYSQEAVREAQVITNRMSAEYGNAAGGVVSAVTKSGTNELHGSIYGFFRDASLNATDWFTGTKEPFSNKNYGGTIGGPIIHDKLFYFGNIERSRLSQTGSISVGVPELDRQYPRGVSDNIGFARLDVELSTSQKLSLRGAYEHKNTENNSVNLIPLLDFTTQTWEVGFGLTSLLGAKGVNEFRYNFLPSNWQRKLKTEFPGLQFPLGRVGQQQNSPWVAAGHYTQLSNSTTYNFFSWGSHTLKAGVSFDYENMYGIFGNNYYGTFLFSRNPTNWGAVLDVVNRNDRAGLQKLVDQGIVPLPSSATFGIGDITYKTPQRLVGLYVQEDWKLNPRLTVNLGLRWDADLGGFMPNFKTRFTQTYGTTKNDLNNWAPRIGFAMDLTGQSKTILRGGIGRYFDIFDNNIVFANKIFNGDQYVQPATFPGTPPRKDFMINPLGTLTLDQVVKQNLAPSDIRPLSSDIESAYTDQTAIGVAQQVTDNLGITADFLHILGVHQLNVWDNNVFCNPVVDPLTHEHEPLPVRQFGRPDPRFNVIRLIRSNAMTRYEGLQIGATRRFNNNFQFVSSYTLSWSSSNSGDTGVGSGLGGACDAAHLAGVSENDQRHRGTFNLVYQLPFGFQVGGIIFATSAGHFAISAGRDLDGNLLVDDSARNPDGSKMPRAGGVGDIVFRVDLRLSKSFAIMERHNVELIAELFNLFNRKNYDSYQSNQSANNFMKPIRSTDLNFQPFQMQLAFRYRF